MSDPNEPPNEGQAEKPQFAFPTYWYDFQPYTGAQVVREQYDGMELRDWFASQAIHGALDNAADTQLPNVARRAYLLADHMMRARERRAK